ncbi:MAG TPA: hypothetical protein VHF87_02375 [Methylomirabilota bacterium]|nr:hypothetical protein [Methylomirabilota bacterium]
MTALDRLATVRMTRLPASRRRELFRAVEAAEAAVALLHRHRVGAEAVPHPIALTPFLVRRSALPSLARLAALVHRLQVHAPALWRADLGGFRALCPVSARTAAWVERDPAHDPAAWSLMIRPDVGLEAGPGGRLDPVLFETNATALAGLYNHAAGVRILRTEVFPRVYTIRERQALADPPDLLALVRRWVQGAARRLGRRRLRGVAFVEDTAPVDGYSEVPRLVAALRTAGIPAERGTVSELRPARVGARLRDMAVDLVYRDLALEDLGRPGTRRLGRFMEYFDAGAVLPGVAGEFSQKGLLEYLVRPEVARLFTPAERRLLRRAVPWTRVLGARVTEDPAGRRVDLPAYVERARERLLIKPNVGSSGAGVLLGREAGSTHWAARIARALREPGGWVVQERRPGTRRSMLYLRAGRAYAGPCYFSLGLFYAPGDLGLHCRVSREPVVNVARQGAVACAFLVTR